MLQKYYPLIAGALLALLLLAGIMLRPVTFHVDGKSITTASGGLTVGQALGGSGIALRDGDRVEPGLDELIPMNGRVQISRASAITLWEDGQARLVVAPGQTPVEILRAGGVTIGPNDRLWWNGKALDPNASVEPGAEMALQLKRARVVLIDADGRQVQAETAASTTAGALWDAGIRIGPGDDLSTPPDAPLQAPPGGGPVMLAHRSAQPVTIRSSGQQITARTTAPTVGEALAEAGIALQGLDYAVPAEAEPLPANGSIQVVRVREEVALTQELIPFESERVPDPETEFDTTRVIEAGRYGVKVTRERARIEDGKEISRGLDSDWVASEPVNQKVGVGTKVVTKTLDIGGETIEYWRAINVYATSYSPCQQGVGRCSWSTSSGIRLRKGIIAVTLAWYRQIRGLEVYVPGYGRGIIADVGGGIPGTPWIDLGFDESDYQPMVGWMTMYMLTPVPANPNLVLP